MKKRAYDILHGEIKNVLKSNSAKVLNDSLTKLINLANIFDQSGNAKEADKIDHFVKEAGFWSSFLSGLAGGGGAGLWDALKEGKLKDSIGEIVKKALIGAGTGIIVEYIIKGLDEVPLIGPYLQELGGADRLRTMLEGIIAGAVAESDIANKLVDKTIEAIEGYLGFGKAMEKAPAKSEQGNNTQQSNKAPIDNITPMASNVG